ncbi:hypothetical protein LJK88_47385 [Paenibacillus sp. P26]|nr:hypothetical protein LJK88_47385 [Paenibacillus sp. P26]
MRLEIGIYAVAAFSFGIMLFFWLDVIRRGKEITYTRSSMGSAEAEAPLTFDERRIAYRYILKHVLWFQLKACFTADGTLLRFFKSIYSKPSFSIGHPDGGQDTLVEQLIPKERMQ